MFRYVENSAGILCKNQVQIIKFDFNEHSESWVSVIMFRKGYFTTNEGLVELDISYCKKLHTGPFKKKLGFFAIYEVKWGGFTLK